MRGTLFEAALGAVVLIVAGVFLAIALSVAPSGASASDRTVIAYFNTVGSLNTGADVRIAGVKVGVVSDVSLDQQRAMAKVVMSLATDMEIYRDDASVIVESESLLGGHYISLNPGSGGDVLPDGGVIVYASPPLSLQNILSKAVNSLSGGGGDE